MSAKQCYPNTVVGARQRHGRGGGRGGGDDVYQGTAFQECQINMKRWPLNTSLPVCDHTNFQNENQAKTKHTQHKKQKRESSQKYDTRHNQRAKKKNSLDGSGSRSRCTVPATLISASIRRAASRLRAHSLSASAASSPASAPPTPSASSFSRCLWALTLLSSHLRQGQNLAGRKRKE